jgi:hypothetical protein
MIKEDVRITNKTNWGKVIVFFVLVGLFILSIYYNNNEYENYRKALKGETIALATRIQGSGKARSLRYYFYSEKKVISEVNTRDYYGDEYELINKFYKVKYNLKDPEENYIILEKELNPDSIMLIKAGFTKIKYYIYDGGVTCKYIEKSKWK